MEGLNSSANKYKLVINLSFFVLLTRDDYNFHPSACIQRVSNIEILEETVDPLFEQVAIPIASSKVSLVSSFTSTARQTAWSIISVVILFCKGLRIYWILICCAYFSFNFFCNISFTVLSSSICTNILTLTPCSAAFSNNSNIPSFFARRNVLAVEYNKSISNVADLRRLRTIFCVSKGSRIVSINCLL